MPSRSADKLRYQRLCAGKKCIQCLKPADVGTRCRFHAIQARMRTKYGTERLKLVSLIRDIVWESYGSA